MCMLNRKLDHVKAITVPREKPLIGFRAWLQRDYPRASAGRLASIAWCDDPRAWDADEPFTTAGASRFRRKREIRLTDVFQPVTRYWVRVRSIRPWGREGLYAFRTPQICRKQAQDDGHSYLGIVFLWGQVVRYDNGYRAQHAQVAQIFGPAGTTAHRIGAWREEQILEARLTYGVQRLDAPFVLPRTMEDALATI